MSEKFDKASIEELKRWLVADESDQMSDEAARALDYPWPVNLADVKTFWGSARKASVQATLSFDEVPDAEDYEIRLAIVEQDQNLIMPPEYPIVPVPPGSGLGTGGDPTEVVPNPVVSDPFSFPPGLSGGPISVVPSATVTGGFTVLIAPAYPTPTFYKVDVNTVTDTFSVGPTYTVSSSGTSNTFLVSEKYAIVVNNDGGGAAGEAYVVDLDTATRVMTLMSGASFGPQFWRAWSLWSSTLGYKFALNLVEHLVTPSSIGGYPISGSYENLNEIYVWDFTSGLPGGISQTISLTQWVTPAVIRPNPGFGYDEALTPINTTAINMSYAPDGSFFLTAGMSIRSGSSYSTNSSEAWVVRIPTVGAKTKINSWDTSSPGRVYDDGFWGGIDTQQLYGAVVVDLVSGTDIYGFVDYTGGIPFTHQEDIIGGPFSKDGYLCYLYLGSGSHPNFRAMGAAGETSVLVDFNSNYGLPTRMANNVIAVVTAGFLGLRYFLITV